LIKITFEGRNLLEVIEQAQFFISSFKKEGITGQSPGVLVGPPGFEPVSPVSANGQIPLAPAAKKLNVKTARAPGRPPMSEEQKAEARANRTKKLLEEVDAVKAQNLHTLETPEIEAIELPEPAKPVSLKELGEALQKVFSSKGRDKCVEILKLFGVERLGELDEKRYHEMMAVLVQEF